MVTKLDRLARSLPDARDIADELTRREVKLNLGGSVHDPTDPVGRSEVAGRDRGRRLRCARGAQLMLLVDGGAGLIAGIVLLLTAVAAGAVFVEPQVALADRDDG